jgi:hypothetical protein
VTRPDSSRAEVEMSLKTLSAGVIVATVLGVPVPAAAAGQAGAAGSGQAAGAPSGRLAITHSRASCVVAGRFAALDARFDPLENVGAARVYFRTAASPSWYWVAMAREGDGYRGVLPKPNKQLSSFDYYVEATDRGLETVRTEEYSPRVQAGLGACQDDQGMAATVGSAKVVVNGPAGAPSVPAGFSSSGIVAAGAAAGAGISTGVLVGGAAGAGALAVGVAAAGGGGSTPSPAASPSAPPAASCTPAGDQWDFGVSAAFTGTLSCADRNRQQVYQVANRSACNLAVQSLQLQRSFNCGGISGQYSTALALAAGSVAPGVSAAVRTAAAGGTKDTSFCCPQGAVCTIACTTTDTYTLTTNAGVKTSSFTYTLDPKLGPCPTCPCAGDPAPCGSPNGDYAALPGTQALLAARAECAAPAHTAPASGDSSLSSDETR